MQVRDHIRALMWQSPDHPSPLERATRRLVVRRLPLFTCGWLATTIAWGLVLTLESGAALGVGLSTLAFQLVVLAAVNARCRRDPVAATVPITVAAACILLGTSSTVLFAAVGGSAEVLAFVLLTLYLASALLFAWGWRLELIVLAATLGVWMLAFPALRFVVPGLAFTTAVLIGSAIALASAEGSARAFRVAFLHRASDEQRERQLQASRDAYRDLAENARDFIYSVDLEGRFTYLNEALARFFGGRVESFIGRSVIREVLTDHPANPDAWQTIARVAAGESMPPLVFQVRAAQGLRWVEALVSGIQDANGRVIGIRGISRDVTERKIAEDALRDSEERFRNVFGSAPIGMAVVGLDGRAMQVNHSLCEMLGYAEHELVGIPIELVTHPDDLGPHVEQVARLLAGEIRSFEIEKRYLHKRGHVVWGLLGTSVARDADGEPAYLISQVQDITQRKEAAEALRGSLDELRASEEKLRLLAQRQVVIREDERKRLGFDLHDDVCQELVGIVILVESLRRHLAPLPAFAAAELDRIVRYLNEVVEHLRLLARDLRPMLLHDLGLEGSLRSLAAGMSSEVTRVAAEFATPIPRLDEEIELAVYRIAQEALVNAARHAAARTIVLTLAVGDGRLKLEVRDDGCGFLAWGRQRSQALGLVSMEERALALSGRFEVWSEPGKGTAVRLECPLASRAPASAA